jgi:hypothetical protein
VDERMDMEADVRGEGAAWGTQDLSISIPENGKNWRPDIRSKLATLKGE